jgi:hypothetical protein
MLTTYIVSTHSATPNYWAFIAVVLLVQISSILVLIRIVVLDFITERVAQTAFALPEDTQLNPVALEDVAKVDDAPGRFEIVMPDSEQNKEMAASP